MSDFAAPGESSPALTLRLTLTLTLIQFWELIVSETYIHIKGILVMILDFTCPRETGGVRVLYEVGYS